jgi:hypothetical protein
MAEKAQSGPELPYEPASEKSFSDEKASIKEQLAPEVEDVYEDVRAIDMGADGKERPIGVHSCYLALLCF